MERSEEHALHQESLMDGFQVTPTTGEEGRKKAGGEVEMVGLLFIPWKGRLHGLDLIPSCVN